MKVKEKKGDWMWRNLSQPGTFWQLDTVRVVEKLPVFGDSKLENFKNSSEFYQNQQTLVNQTSATQSYLTALSTLKKSRKMRKLIHEDYNGTLLMMMKLWEKFLIKLHFFQPVFWNLRL